MRVAIIGAGWYGCHIALGLLQKGVSVTLFDKDDRVFAGASQYNTGRLHLGFHYPRSARTRQQSREGFNRFVNTYPHFCEDVDSNLYLISAKNSLLDFDTYIAILKNENQSFQQIDPKKYGFENIEAGIEVDEKAIQHVKAASFFSEKLSTSLRLSHEIKSVTENSGHVLVNSEEFDYCINCTYSAFSPAVPVQQVAYENVVTVMLRPNAAVKKNAFVIMDGDFFSLNPYFATNGEYLFSLYHVSQSVVSCYSDFTEAKAKDAQLKSIASFEQQLNWEKVKEDALFYYPAFFNEYTPVGSFVSIRTKLINKNASRECLVDKQGKVINVLSGKINSIFEAEEQVIKLLGI